jgi:hypothetical protein
MTGFWDIAPCSLVEVDRRFRGVYCLHHLVGLLQRDYTVLYTRRLSLHTRRRDNPKSYKVLRKIFGPKREEEVVG